MAFLGVVVWTAIVLGLIGAARSLLERRRERIAMRAIMGMTHAHPSPLKLSLFIVFWIIAIASILSPFMG